MVFYLSLPISRSWQAVQNAPVRTVSREKGQILIISSNIIECFLERKLRLVYLRNMFNRPYRTCHPWCGNNVFWVFFWLLLFSECFKKGSISQPVLPTPTTIKNRRRATVYSIVVRRCDVSQPFSHTSLRRWSASDFSYLCRCHVGPIYEGPWDESQ